MPTENVYHPDLPGVGHFDLEGGTGRTPHSGAIQFTPGLPGTTATDVWGVLAGADAAFGAAGGAAGIPTGGTGSSSTSAGSGAGSVNGQAAASIANVLTDFGLEALIPLVDGWVRGGLSMDEVMLQLRDPKTEAGRIFDQRFPAIQLRRAANLTPISPGEYVAYERSARQIMQSAGLPVGFYDSQDDFTKFLVDDVTIGELTSRVTDGFAAVATAPTEVRSAFTEYFGANGDAALAAFFLDRSRALPLLEKIVATAEVGGAGKQFGFHVEQSRARRIADAGFDYGQARGAFSTLSDLSGVFQESVSERTDLTAEREGVDAAFSLDDGSARRMLTDRVDQRVAAGMGSGGAAASERGAFGLGTAR